MKKFLVRYRHKLILTLSTYALFSINGHANHCCRPDLWCQTNQHIFWDNTSFQIGFPKAEYAGSDMLGSNDGGHDPNEIKVNKKLRKEWIKNSIEAFYAHRMNDNIPELFFVEKKFDDFYQKSIKLKARGLIEFSENSWLYLVAHSEHDDPQIGDITLAIDHLGNVYMHEGHICGGMIHFIINREIPVNSVNDFIENFRDDTVGMTWKKIPFKHKKTPKT